MDGQHWYLGLLKESREPDYIEQLNENDKAELLEHVNPFLLEKGGHIQSSHLNLKGLYATYLQGHFLNGMDYSLMRSFKLSSKEIQGLETRKEISSFFQDLDFSAFQEMIKNRAGFNSEEASKMKDSYLAGAIPEENPAFKDEIKERNLKWADKITDFHERYSEKMVVAVGYGHLFDTEYGLLGLLTKKNFIIKRMRVTGDFLEFKL